MNYLDTMNRYAAIVNSIQANASAEQQKNNLGLFMVLCLRPYGAPVYGFGHIEIVMMKGVTSSAAVANAQVSRLLVVLIPASPISVPLQRI